MEAGWHTWTRHIRTVFHQLKKRRWPAFFRLGNTSIAGGMAR
jgi:hypothetical protein